MDSTKTIINSEHRLGNFFSELWKHRELVYFFSWRDIKVKYNHTFLGFLWALIQPLGLVTICYFVFSNRFKEELDGVPYFLFSLTGLVVWQFFSAAVTSAADSVVQQAAILKKIYFPRFVMVLASFSTAFIELVAGIVLVVVACVVLGFPLSIHALWSIPLAVLVTIITALGLGSLLAGFSVQYKDFRYTLPFLLQILFFASAIIYPAHSGFHRLPLSNMNPLNTAMSLMRISLYGTNSTEQNLVGAGVAAVLMVLGIWYFTNVESKFADLA